MEYNKTCEGCALYINVKKAVIDSKEKMNLEEKLTQCCSMFLLLRKKQIEKCPCSECLVKVTCHHFCYKIIDINVQFKVWIGINYES